MHTDSIHHPVVASLPPVIFKAWVQMLCLAKIGDGVIPPVDEIAFHLRCGLNSATKWTSELVNDYGLLEPGPAGTFRPKNWDKHQFKSDNVTERVRAFRKRRGNVSETPPESEYRVQSQKQSTESEKSITLAFGNPHRLAEETRKQEVVIAIVRGLADQQPNPQDFDAGIDAAMREILSSANPEITVRTMQENIPLWWAAMREGRPGVRVKPMRYVITDRDYLRPPPKPAEKAEPKRRPNYRMGEIE